MFFEDFTVGWELVTDARTVTDADIAAFAAVSGDHNPLHLDDEYARQTMFGGRIAHGALGIAMATGLLSATGITAGSILALTGIEWRFRAPIRPGDAVRMRLRVAEATPMEGQGRGLVRFAVAMLNQRDEVVQSGVLTELLRSAPPAAD